MGSKRTSNRRQSRRSALWSTTRVTLSTTYSDDCTLFGSLVVPTAAAFVVSSGDAGRAGLHAMLGVQTQEEG